MTVNGSPPRALPLRRQVEAVLRDQITDGALLPGQRLPPEEQLRGQFGISRGTLRHALDSLARDGLLKRVHGRGTFVAELVQPDQPRALLGIDDVIRSARDARRLDRIGRALAPRVVSTSLGIDPRVALDFFIRVTGDVAPVRFGIKRYLAPRLARQAKDLAQERDFESMLQHAGLVGIGEAWAEAILAEPRFAQLLAVPVGTALLSAWWVTLLNGQPVACTQMLRPGPATAISLTGERAQHDL